VLAAVQLNFDGLAFGRLGVLVELIDFHVAICARRNLVEDAHPVCCSASVGAASLWLARQAPRDAGPLDLKPCALPQLR
jgi:hypothetical protein